MNSRLRRYGYVMIVAVLVSASAAFAQQTSVVLTGTGNNTVEWGSSVGVYVDPYTATVGGVPNTTVICDDWSNNSYVGESWTANVTNLTAVSSGSPMFGNNASAQNLYNELAWLGSNLLANYSSSPTAAQQAAQITDSFAIWQLTYGANGTYEDPLAPTTANFPLNQTAITNQINAAIAAVSGGYTGTGWEILTPVAGTITPTTDGIPQEFLVYTPESSTIVLLGADILGLLALAFVFRKRLLLPVS